LYSGLSDDAQFDVTINLIEKHPLCMEELRDLVLKTWDDMMNSTYMGGHIIFDLELNAQTLGNIFHTVFPKKLNEISIHDWRKDRTKKDKDVICEKDSEFSFEIKTSSSNGQIYGNKSYAQPPAEGEKSKDGYYLAVNFEKNIIAIKEKRHPKITKIQFGYLECSDWRPQASDKGQAATLSPETYKRKLVCLYEKDQFRLL